ncbi:DUF2249 domain-containing protein [Paenibacillus amylolyticus]|jgi:uncharacterized protein (DUF2249 family)|uniref:DUF2249 domain-containing protein n=1 Tax=Paenibacillus amylolyticus TaxID=1451 RepID=A0A5M9WYF7_PAEAM|nr:DUF2249 domain-containing protein [Paenibacillus amylolyticus]KAA8786403.1 DUF2249 domain-containing protein [Paenibacillus amylolyticus]
MPETEVNIVELDVRPHLSKKLEPFQLIMDTVKELRHEDVLVLHAPFKPTPLLGILKMKGYSSTSERLESNHWVTTFVHKKNKTAAGHISAAVQSNTSTNQSLASSLIEDSGLEDAVSSCEGQPPAIAETSKSEVLSDEATTQELKEPTIALDNRGLEPPQPMMRTLAALERCKPGEVVLIHNDRVPVFLIEELNQLGCLYTVEDQADGTAKVRIEKG